jgi:hypothetical protein
MVRDAEFRTQTQYPNSEHQHLSPKSANLGKQCQPDGKKQHKEKNCGDQIHGAEAELRQGTVHEDHAAAMSTGMDTIGYP